jgi:predicted PurR-regulated permease PerM
MRALRRTLSPRRTEPDAPVLGESWVGVGRLVVAFMLFTLYLARQALLTIYVSVVLAIGFSPLVRFIEQRRLQPVAGRVPRWAAILSIYLVIFTAVIGTIVMLLPAIAVQARQLVDQLPTLLERVRGFLIAYGLNPPAISFEMLVQQLPGASNVAGTVLLTMFNLVGGVFGIVAILGLSFYLLVESASLFDNLLRLFPRERRTTIRVVAAEITAKVSAWLAMQGMLAALIGITTAVGLWLLGMPYIHVLALIAAVGELIPIIGPIVAAIPALAVAATVSLPMMLATGAFYLLQQQLENHVLVPRLMGDRVGLSAAVVIVALLLGGSLLGMLGVILAIPTAAIVQVIFQHVFSDR